VRFTSLTQWVEGPSKRSVNGNGKMLCNDRDRNYQKGEPLGCPHHGSGFFQRKKMKKVLAFLREKQEAVAAIIEYNMVLILESSPARILSLALSTRYLGTWKDCMNIF
jgi:hypothetical protein